MTGNGTDPAPLSLPALLASAVERHADREFLRFDALEPGAAVRSVTYAEAGRRVRVYADGLHRLGIREGDRVVLYAPNDLDWPLVWLAVVQLGAIVVPANAGYQADDLDHVVVDSGAAAIVTDGRCAELAARCAAGHSLPCATFEELASAPGAERHAVPDDPRRTATIQYTSGTTGLPKGCVLSHGYWLDTLTTHLEWTGMDSGDVLLMAQQCSYLDPQWSWNLALGSGATLVILSRFSVRAHWQAVRDHRATVFYAIGAMPTLLFKQEPAPDDRRHDLRVVLCSGVPRELHARIEERWGVPWRECYGLTETGSDLGVPLDADEWTGTGVVGRPFSRKSARLVDADGAVIGADGVVGELQMRGRPMMDGYWRRPEETARAFDGGWFSTGDLAERIDGQWFRLMGRKKDMIRRGGENVSSAEVEAVLNEHPDVMESAVFGVSDDLFGEEVKAVVVVRGGLARDQGLADSIGEFASRRLARFKVPTWVEFADSLAKTPSQRVIKGLLDRGTAESLRVGGVHERIASESKE